jgi:hypothetical protein
MTREQMSATWREIPRGSSTRSTTFYQELGVAGKFRWELRRPVARQARAYPQGYPGLKRAGTQRISVDSKKSRQLRSLQISVAFGGAQWT